MNNKSGTIVTFDFTPILSKPTLANSTNRETNAKEIISDLDEILYIATTPRLQELLQHPYIMTLLYYKWYLMRYFFYGNVAIFFAVAVSLLCYIYHSITTEANLSTYFLAVFVTILFMKEVMEIRLLKTKYISFSEIFKVSRYNIQNVIEILLSLLSIAILIFDNCSYGSTEKETKKILYIIWVLLAAVGLLQTLEQLPYFNCQVATLKKVASNIFSILLLYVIIFVAFAFCFTILYKKQPNEIESNVPAENGTKVDSDDELHFFDNLFHSTFKTVIMMTGEFDMSASLDFKRYPVASCVLFFAFVFVVVIVCFNLLIGIAVSDIENITKKALHLGLLARIHHIIYVELLLERCTEFREDYMLGANKTCSVKLTAQAKLLPNASNTNKWMLHKLLSFLNFGLWNLRLGEQFLDETLIIVQNLKQISINSAKEMQIYEQHPYATDKTKSLAIGTYMSQLGRACAVKNNR